MSKLNENILQVFLETNEWSDEDTCWQINRNQASSAIEKLFLTTHIEMLRDLVGKMETDTDRYNVNLQIKPLLEQLSELK